MKTVKAFQCEFCAPGRGRAYLSASSCKRHEENCFDNTATRSCGTCKHLLRYLSPVEGTPGHVTPAYKCAVEEQVPLITRCPSWVIRPEQVEE